MTREQAKTFAKDIPGSLVAPVVVDAAGNVVIDVPPEALSRGLRLLGTPVVAVGEYVVLVPLA